MRWPGDAALVLLGIGCLLLFVASGAVVFVVGFGIGDSWVIHPQRPGVWWFVPWIFAGLCMTCFWGLVRPRGFGPGRCEQCGYDLRASKERCPECGRAV